MNDATSALQAAKSEYLEKYKGVIAEGGDCKALAGGIATRWNVLLHELEAAISEGITENMGAG